MMVNVESGHTRREGDIQVSQNFVHLFRGVGEV